MREWLGRIGTPEMADGQVSGNCMCKNNRWVRNFDPGKKKRIRETRDDERRGKKKKTGMKVTGEWKA